MTLLNAYPTGTRIAIADRTFKKVTPGSFWREDLGEAADRVTDLPAVTLAGIEMGMKTKHIVLSLTTS